MSNSEKEFPKLFGWSSFFESQVADLTESSLVLARVICEERGLYRTQIGTDKAVWAAVSGTMQFNAKLRADYPAVGDWVLLDLPDEESRGVIQEIVPRKTTIYRKQAGLTTDQQILSTNVDRVFVTTSVNEDLNPRRIERFLALVWESGAIPVILLTKADICERSIDDVVKEMEVEFPGVEVCSLSQKNYEEAEFLPKYLTPGTTSVFVGSSGVGKSTLVNFLIGEDHIKTQEIREGDGKGRHTTTSRNLYLSRFGGMVIDTPGIRELQLSDQAEGVSTQFEDIEVLVATCRFSDCKHKTEPGCAVLTALEEGSLTKPRWVSYQKLEAEAQHGLRKKDQLLAAEEKKKWKKISIFAKKKSRDR